MSDSTPPIPVPTGGVSLFDAMKEECKGVFPDDVHKALFGEGEDQFKVYLHAFQSLFLSFPELWGNFSLSMMASAYHMGEGKRAMVKVDPIKEGTLIH